MINASIPSSEIIRNYGIAVWLVVLVFIGLLIITGLLVRHLLKTHEKEREANQEERKLHQQFFSDAIKSNTQALVRTADTLSEASSNIRYSLDALARVEQIAISSKEDFQELNAIQMDVHRDIGSLTTKIDNFQSLQLQCQEICKRKVSVD